MVPRLYAGSVAALQKVLRLYSSTWQKNLKELHMEFDAPGPAEFALALKQKLPQVKITSWALGRLKAGRGNRGGCG